MSAPGDDTWIARPPADVTEQSRIVAPPMTLIAIDAVLVTSIPSMRIVVGGGSSLKTCSIAFCQLLIDPFRIRVPLALSAIEMAVPLVPGRASRRLLRSTVT